MFLVYEESLKEALDYCAGSLTHREHGTADVATPCSQYRSITELMSVRFRV